MENSKIRINIEDCIKCKICVDECSCYYFEDDSLCLIEDFEDFCIECGHCVAVCPPNIIRLKVYSAEEVIQLPEKENLPTFNLLANLFQTRRSRRQFKEAKVPKELIERILTIAGRYSATGHNEQNVHFTIVQDRELLRKISEECNLQISNLVKKFETKEGRESLKKVMPEDIMEKIEELIPSFKRKLIRIEQGKEVWRWDAELIIIHSPKEAASLIENCTLAVGQIMLAAETLGLGTCSLGYITAWLNQFRSVSKIVKIPLKHIVGYTLAIGYPKAKYLRIPIRKPLKAKWF
jgi:nitroreductase/NAD-dependent dihydropyrimidine dehydrogenase PreA subunit